jgi:hypothetical protein
MYKNIQCGSKYKTSNKKDNNIIIINFFILTCWLNSCKSQLQSQHKEILNVQKSAARE